MKYLLFFLFFFSQFSLHSQVESHSSLGQTFGKEILFVEKPCTTIMGSLTYSSESNWRGLPLVDGSVIQSELVIAKKGVSLGAFANIDLTNQWNRRGELTEGDFFAAYTQRYTIFGCSLIATTGGIYYHFLDPIERHSELFTGVQFCCDLSPAVAVYYDIDRVNGWYVVAGFGEEWPFQLTRSVKGKIEGKSSIGWGSSRYNSFYFSLDSARFLDFQCSLAIPLVYRCLSLTPFMAYSTFIDKNIRTHLFSIDNFWGGLSLSSQF